MSEVPDNQPPPLGGQLQLQSEQLQKLMDMQIAQSAQIEELKALLEAKAVTQPAAALSVASPAITPNLGASQILSHTHSFIAHTNATQGPASQAQGQSREDSASARGGAQPINTSHDDGDTHSEFGITPPDELHSTLETTVPLSFGILEPLGMDAINTGLDAIGTTFSILTGRPRPQSRRVERTASATTMPMRGLNAEGTVVMVADVLFVITSSFICIFAVSMLNPIGRKDELEEAQLVWLWHIQVLSLFWVALRFFVRRRVGKWTIVDNLEDIRSQYLRSWFAFDMLYSFPLEIFFLHGYGSSSGLYYTLPRHFLRFLRFTSLISSVNPLTAFRQWFRFIAYLSVMMFITHCYAHTFLYLAITYEDPEVTQGLTYLDSLYWATASLTSVGYGDVPTTSSQGRILCIIVMTSGVIMIATFTAFATAFLTFKDSLTLEQDGKKNHMAAMLHYYKIPWDVQRQVIQVFPSIIDNETERQFREAVEIMPQFVREKLMLYFNAHHLKQVSLFSGVAEKNPEVLLEVTKTMVQHIYAPNEYIVRAGDEGHEMFIILSGTVEVLRPADDGGTKLFATLSRGDWFGEQSVLVNGAVCSADIATLTTTEVLILAKGPMLKVLEKCPDILEKIRKVQQRQQRSAGRSRSRSVIGLSGTQPSTPSTRSHVPLHDDFPLMDLDTHPLRDSEEMASMPHHTPLTIQ